jgi:hypothetical protein
MKQIDNNEAQRDPETREKPPKVVCEDFDKFVERHKPSKEE